MFSALKLLLIFCYSYHGTVILGIRNCKISSNAKLDSL